MPKKMSLFVALTVLIGAPLIANLVSRAVPSAESADAATEPAPSAPSVAEQAPPPPPPPIPIPPIDSLTQPVDGGANALVDTAPLLEPHGIDPSPADDLDRQKVESGEREGEAN